MDTSQTVIDNRYVLQDRLGAGGMGAVYLAFDLLTRKRVALKHLTTPTEQILFKTKSGGMNLQLALAQEFRTLATLRHPHIISVYDFGFDKDNLPYYTMEYLPEALNIVEAAEDLTLNGKVNLVIQMLQAIKYLHRRGVLHRDLKPDNVLVIDNHIRVMDFGLAADATTDMTQRDEKDIVAGTIAYMPREILRGERATRKSDLWSVGVMFYEMLTGEFPFERSTITNLIMAIMEQQIDFQPLVDMPKVLAVLLRLLAHEPKERYADANQVIDDLSEAIDQPLSQESQAIRESYLKASRFVGREAELATLKSALDGARGSIGSAWLIGGESGVGKSRFTEEVRISALVSGFSVLQGQATTEAGTPYELWREPLRKLVLRTSLSEIEAGVLKALIPDIEELLGRKVSDPPDADEQAAQARLMSIIVSMFRQQKQPMLLMFEDLHWVKDGIGLLSHLTRFIQELPLVVIATYRDDEAHDLPRSLPNMSLMSLKRLDSEMISQLAANILGTYAQQEHVVDFLHRETEGNVFFLVEVIRTLAEQSGRLDQIGQATLPRSIFAQGIVTIMQHRLEHVADEDRPCLDYAAVMGRGLDLKLLMHAFPLLDVEAWLLRMAEANIIEVNNNAWRFSHDKLREAIIAQLPAAQLHQQHANIADHIQRVYRDAQNGLVAYHLEKSLDLTQPNPAQLEKTIFALARAAEVSATTYANNQAMELYSRVLELEKIHRQWAEESEGRVKPLDDTQVADWHVRLGMAQFVAFMYSSTRENLEMALILLNQPMPNTNMAAGRRIIGQMTQQILHRFFPSRYFNQASQNARDNLTQVAEIINSIGTVYYMTGKSLNSLYSSLGNLNINELLGPSTNLAQSYAQMCLLLGSMGSRRMADYYYQKAIDVLDEIQSPAAEAQVYVLTSVYYIGQVEYERVRKDISRATVNHLARGDVWSAGYSRLIYATTFFGEGDYATATSLFEEILSIANEKRILQQGVFAYTWLARMTLLRGDKVEARSKIEQALVLLQEMQSNDQSVVDPWALAALIFVYNGSYELAYHAAEKATQLAIHNKTTGQWGKHAFPALVNVYLDLRDHADDLPVDSAQLLQKAKAALRSLLTLPDTMARIIAYHSQGRIAHAEGNLRQAYKFWERGLLEAQKRSMPLEEATYHHALGRYLPDGHAQKSMHQKAARDIFMRLNAKLYLNDVESHVLSTEGEKIV